VNHLPSTHDDLPCSARSSHKTPDIKGGEVDATVDVLHGVDQIHGPVLEEGVLPAPGPVSLTQLRLDERRRKRLFPRVLDLTPVSSQLSCVSSHLSCVEPSLMCVAISCVSSHLLCVEPSLVC
jgi:hypothetical protein